MKISVSGQSLGQPLGQPGNEEIGKPQHESTRLSSIFFSELANVSQSSKIEFQDSSVCEYFEIQKEHLIVEPDDRMNQTTFSSHRNSDNLFSNTNAISSSGIPSSNTSHLQTQNSQQNILSNDRGEYDTCSDNLFSNTNAISTSEISSASTSQTKTSKQNIGGDNDTFFADASSASIKSPIRKKQKKNPKYKWQGKIITWFEIDYTK